MNKAAKPHPGSDRTLDSFIVCENIRNFPLKHVIFNKLLFSSVLLCYRFWGFKVIFTLAGSNNMQKKEVI